MPAEGKSISDLDAFTPAPSGGLFKGFFFNEADAQSFATRIGEMTGDPTTVVSGKAPTSLVNSSPPHVAASEGPGVLIKNEDLPQVKVNEPDEE